MHVMQMHPIHWVRSVNSDTSIEVSSRYRPIIELTVVILCLQYLLRKLYYTSPFAEWNAFEPLSFLLVLDISKPGLFL